MTDKSSQRAIISNSFYNWLLDNHYSWLEKLLSKHQFENTTHGVEIFKMKKEFEETFFELHLDCFKQTN